MALATTADFGFVGLREKHDMQAGCKPDCPEADVQAARSKILIANVSFGVGVAAIGASLFTYFASRSPGAPSRAIEPRRASSSGAAQDPPAPTAHGSLAIGLDIVPMPGGGSVGVELPSDVRVIS